MNADQSVLGFPLISTEGAKDAIARAIGLYIGNGRKFSFEEAGSALGMKPGTLYSYVRDADRHTPPADTLLRLCQFLGPEFTSKVLSSTGQGAYFLEPQPGEPGYVIAKLSKGVAEFAVRGADHRFCHIDRSALEPEADEMIQILTPFSSKVGE